MPEVKLNIPTNSKFKSSLNEIDIAIGGVLLNQMRIADPRSITGELSALNEIPSTWLWDESRVFQVDELTTEEIFNTFLLRKEIYKKKGVDVSYPILAYLQNDIKTAFWGTGNRYKQWFFDIPVDPDSWEIGDTVFITEPLKYRTLQAEIHEILNENECTLTINGTLITESLNNNKTEAVKFKFKDLRPTGDKIPSRYKAKAITGTYTAVVLCDTRDEAQYLRDKFILRCADAQIWHTYHSPMINSENQIFTVFGIPNIERYPLSADKLKGSGYIYGIAFNIDIWGCLTDEPLPGGFIETIRMNLHVEGEDRVNRIVIS